MTEEFRDIKDYEGLYQVSNFGQVKRLESRRGNGKGYIVPEHILQQWRNNCGYCYVSLCKNGKTKKFRVHRLVAEAFVPNPEGKPEVDHIDRNRENNYANNLRWATHIENNLNKPGAE